MKNRKTVAASSRTLRQAPRLLYKPVGKHLRATMEIEEKLTDFLNQIDRKREFTDYTMTELQKISEKSIKLISEFNSNSESLVELKKAIDLSNKYHKNKEYKNVDNIMEVLRATKFGIEEFIESEL
jgi:hypothetical protein